MSENTKQIGVLAAVVLVVTLLSQFVFYQFVVAPQQAAQQAQQAALVDAVKKLSEPQVGVKSVTNFDSLQTDSTLTVGSNATVGGTLGVTGATTLTGALTANGGITNAGGSTGATYLSVSAPTAIASATPAVRINSLGANDDLLVVSKASTPVFTIGNGGAVTLTGGINGNKCYKGSQTVLGAATVIPATLTAAGISTPSWVSEGFAAAPGNTYWNHAHVNAAGVVTLNVYQNINGATVTPQAATTSVAIDYEVCGQ